MHENAATPGPPLIKPASVTEEILRQFGEALLESGQFDPDTVHKLMALVTGRSQPTAAEIVKLLVPREATE